MYHIHSKGTHYETGFIFGSRLKKFGINLLKNIPFEINQERIQFSNTSIPVYEKHFPQILDEIKGISDGNACCYEKLCAVLLSMYCIMPEDVHCSCVALRNQNGVYFARNSDFLVEIEKLCMNTIYHFSNGSYAFNGNTTAFVEMEDGINEYGLTIGLTSVYPKQIQPGLNAGMLLRLFLERCKSVEEVISLIKQLPIASSQTFTLADSHGDIAYIECSSSKIEVNRPTTFSAFVCATNRFHLKGMEDQTVNVVDDWFSKERQLTMQTTLENKYEHMSMLDILDLMSGKLGFLSQYDRKTGKDTVWSVAYDANKKQLYRVEGNPSRKLFKQDLRFKFRDN